MTWGVTPVGFNAKPLATVESEIDTGLKGILGESAGTEPDGTIPLRSIAGQLKVLLTDGFSAMWDLAEAIASSFDPNAAVDAQQDVICSITGTLRDPATNSRVTCACTGTPGTLLKKGRVASVQVTGSRFSSLADATLPPAITAWAGTTGYSLGDRRTNANRIYQVITAGTSAGSGGPITTAADITDGSVHWLYLGDGTSVVDVVFSSEQTGPVGALAQKLTIIATPVSGWRGVINVSDASPGANRESNADLRVKRDAELSAEGLGTRDAIRAHLLKVNEGSTDPAHDPVLSVHVFVNDTDFTDTNGLPPHSIEALVRGAPDQDVANALFACAPAGIYLNGTTTTSVTDSEGNTQTVRFTRPTLVPIYVRADVTYYAVDFPSDLSAGTDLIKAALLLYGESFPVGKSVRSSALEATIFDGPTEAGGSPTPGILDVTALFISIAPTPTVGTTIAIAARELATFSTAHMTVNLASGTP